MKIIRINKNEILNADHVVSFRIEKTIYDEGTAFIVYELSSGREARQEFDSMEDAIEDLNKLVYYLAS